MRREMRGGPKLSTKSREVQKTDPRRPDLALLLQRAGLRDESSFVHLYDLLSPIVFGLALRILSNTSAAEDTLVEVFSGIWDQRFPFDAARESPLAWLTSITRARALERRRCAGNVVPMIAALEPSGETAADVPNAETWLVEESVRSRGALEALPGEVRRAVEMAYFEGLAAEEIAQRLVVSSETVGTRIRLGLIQLREALSPASREGCPQ